MIIKPHLDIPRTYAPDVGEIIEARRTPADKFIKAAVLDARRNRTGRLRVKLQWLEGDPDAGCPHVSRTRKREPIVALSVESVVVPPDGAPPLIRQISRGAAS